LKLQHYLEKTPVIINICEIAHMAKGKHLAVQQQEIYEYAA
jgi:hypothetical protein